MKLNLLKRIIFIMSLNYLLTIIFCTCAMAGVVLPGDGNAQSKSIKEVIITMELNNAPVKAALNSIEGKTDFRFFYREGTLRSVQDQRITLNATNQSVAFFLKKIATETGLMFKQVDGMINVKIPEKPKQKSSKKQEEAKLPDQIISGKVTDEKGEPLPGASILVKGTSVGVVTDKDGNYRLLAPDDAAILVFSFVGYVAEEVVINGRVIIDVMLSPDITTLQEVVVSTGYWETEEKLNPGNIAKVSAKEIERQPVATPLQALIGRVAGANITQKTGMPGGGIDIQIRGRNSLRSEGNAPLYIVDGVPIPSATLLSSRVQTTVYNSTVAPINNFNPSDIESIEILKDADATAIYGSRGANGVVLITTKKGRPGKTRFDINHSTGVGQVNHKMDLLNTEQYREMVIEALANDGFDPVPDFFKPFLPSVFVWDSTRFTDWQEELIGGTANYNNTRLSLSGGNANTQFLLSGSHFRQTTVFPGDFAMNRGSGLFNLNHNSTDQKFSTSLSLNYIAEKNNFPRADPTSSAVSLPPNAPMPFDSLGNLNFEDNTFGQNPFAELLKPYEAKKRNLVANLNLGYEVLPGLTLKANLGYNYTTIDEIVLIPISSRNPSFNPTGSTISGKGNSETWIIEPQTEYKKDFGSGELRVLVGATLQASDTEQENIVAFGYTSDAMLGNINAAPNVEPANPIFFEYNYNALFGRVNYSWKGKYIVNLTGRRDGSSRFGPGNQFGNFGAIGAAWIFSNESFIQSTLPFLSFGKLRASYGTTGSDQIPNYEFLETHSTTRFAYLGTSGLIPSRLPNDEFGWETNKKIEAGIELGFKGDRIFLTASYYRNRSSNQLVGIPLAATTGFSSVRSNFPATVQNTGWEFELNTTNIKTNDFQWNTNFNLTIPRNELIEFPNIEGSTFANEFTVGKSLFNTKGFKSTGVDPETGLYTFEDQNEDDQISSPEDLLPVREIAQDYFGGIGNSFSYKGFQLDFLFRFVKQTGADYRTSFGQPGGQVNQPAIVLNRWQKEGDDADIQKYSIGFDGEALDAFFNSEDGSGSIVDASFIRLQNVSLSYGFPQAVLERLKVVESLRIYVQGQNLLTITDYIGMDPETLNSTALPPLRMLTAGINVGF